MTNTGSGLSTMKLTIYITTTILLIINNLVSSIGFKGSRVYHQVYLIRGHDIYQKQTNFFKRNFGILRLHIVIILLKVTPTFDLLFTPLNYGKSCQNHDGFRRTWLDRQSVAKANINPCAWARIKFNCTTIIFLEHYNTLVNLMISFVPGLLNFVLPYIWYN